MRIFHVISGFENGGVEMLIERWLSFMPREVKFHVVAHDVPVPACAERIRALGAEIHLIPCRKHPLQHLRALRALFRTYRPDVVHVHTTEWGFLALQAARRCGVAVRIQHSHAAGIAATGLRALSLRLRFWAAKRAATAYFACGSAAARTAFGKRAVEAGKVKLLQNGIDTAAFAYNAALRDKARLALGIGEEQRVIGMVARFSPQKDHAAALRIFAAYHKENPNAVLLLVGDGPLRCEIERDARVLLPAEAVRFLGVREDTPALYAAMDAFLLSSRFEGFPMSLVEAQTSGLPSAVSDRVSAETAVTDLVRFLPVAEPQRWCAALDAVPAHPRGDYAVKMAERGFSLQTAAEELAEFYLKS